MEDESFELFRDLDFNGDDLVGDTTCSLLEDTGDLFSGDAGYLLVLIIVGD